MQDASELFFGKSAITEKERHCRSRFASCRHPLGSLLQAKTSVFEDIDFFSILCRTDTAHILRTEHEIHMQCGKIQPLRHQQGVIPASIGMTGPKARIFMKDPVKLADKLHACGEEISKKLRLIRYEFEY